jgi:hypothetical protein
MGIVQLPAWRLAGNAERLAFRHGLAVSGKGPSLLRLIPGSAPAPAYCSSCAAPIDVGVVWRGGEAYCSVECSLGGDRAA